MTMQLKEIKSVQLFKYSDDKTKQVGIYVEPTKEGYGRLIISTQYKIFQRYFDGAKPDIYSFLSKEPVEAICSCFNDSEEDYYYLLEFLKDVWPQFRKDLTTSALVKPIS